MAQYKNNPKFTREIRLVGKYNRFDPRAGRKVDVGSYFRGQYIKKEKTISPKIVEKSFEEQYKGNIKGSIGTLDDWAKLEPNELDRHLQKYSLEQIKKASNSFLSSQEKGKGKEKTIKTIVNKVQKLKTHYQMGPPVSKNIKSEILPTDISPPKDKFRHISKIRRIKIKIDTYTYTRKDGKEIEVPGYNKKVFIEPAEVEIKKRKIRGEDRWVEIFKYKDKAYMRVFIDRRKDLEISQPEDVKKRTYNNKTMKKTIPDNLAKGFKEIAKDKREHSIMVDFERNLDQPQRSAIIQGGPSETLKYKDFELFGHTHPGSRFPGPSTSDLRTMNYLEPEFIIAGATGKMIIVNIEDPIQYDRWKSRMVRIAGGTNPIIWERFDNYLKKEKYKKITGLDYYMLSKSKEGRDLFFEETGVKVYPYKKNTTLEMKDDPHLEKKMPYYEKRMPSVAPQYLKKWKPKK